MHSQRTQNYTDIYELLRKLCKTVVGDRYGECFVFFFREI